MVRYHRQNLTCHAVIGILPHERKAAQPVVVDVRLEWVRLPDGSWPIGLAAIDDELGTIVPRVLQEGRFLLVETAIQALGLVLARLLTGQVPQVKELELTITKVLALESFGLPILRWRQTLLPSLKAASPVIFDSPEARISWEDPGKGSETLRVTSKEEGFDKNLR